MKVQRLPANPIIHQGLSADIGNNINGPSLIEAPDWLPNRLGRYYLYFAHHSGKFIRLAVSDNLSGPWRYIHGGVLSLENSWCGSHIASPDVHVDHENKRIVMFYHGPPGAADRDEAARLCQSTGLKFDQITRVASAPDGVNFTAEKPIVAPAYFRRFEHDSSYFGISMPMAFCRSTDGITNWEPGPSFMNPQIRHSATLARNGKLMVFFSRREDCPERILCTRFDLSSDWKSWTHVEPWDVLLPETDWEGGLEPLVPSQSGKVNVPVRQLRDPGIFTNSQGEDYLLYSSAGEQGIAIARLYIEPEDWTRIA